MASKLFLYWFSCNSTTFFFSLHKTKVCNKTDCSFVTSYNPPRHAYKRKVCNTDKKKKQNKLKGKIVEKKI